ncbi:hypothetical protein H072_7032 [Dactylellina haptotyla CBS 200.50]|uniref:Uncharacterized protein n=1 Tax=Dactylellina haptotyla (strain CBS 200.50) TaxID=1284197 RepID=S8A849_DACHA|nr:hypothetical protein H072_7032 [Dactylellina haptotyla CBS 200.50]
MESNSTLPPGLQPPVRHISLAETIIRAYTLRDLLPAFETRQSAILEPTGGDVIFTVPHETQIRTYSALFSIAAAARGRPAIAPEKYSKQQRQRVGTGNSDHRDGIGTFLPPGEGDEDERIDKLLEASAGLNNSNSSSGDGVAIVRCYDEQFAHVKRVYNHVVTKTAEQLDRLLDEVLKSAGEGYVDGGVASPDFRIQLEVEEDEEDEEGENGGKRRAVSVPVKAPKMGITARKKVDRVASGPVTPGKDGKRPLATAKGARAVTPGRGGKKPETGGTSTAQDGGAGTPKSSTPSKVAPKATAPEPKTEDATKYAEIRLHRFMVTSSISYYKYLNLGRMSFADSASNVSTLPFPTVTYYALRVIQRWVYNPLRIGEVIEEFEPNSHLYLVSSCKRHDKNGYPPPLATAKGIVEVARAADYLGIEELATWASKTLRRICHGVENCTGNNCKLMVPFVLELVYKTGGLGLSDELVDDLKLLLVKNIETMWKKPVIMLPDELLEELLASFRKLHGCEPTWDRKNSRRGEGRVAERKPLNWWQTFIELTRVRSSIRASSTGNSQRWMDKLLRPAMEHCVHQIAAGFHDPRLAADLQSKMDSGSFERTLVVEMLMMVTTASTTIKGFPGEEDVSIQFEKPPLTRRTVRAVFEGLVNLRTWDGRDGEWGTAEKRVMDFLQKEWLTIVTGGEEGSGKSGFVNWRPAMLAVVSRKLRVSVDELCGKGQKKPLGMNGVSLKGGKRIVKDRLGNDIEAGSSSPNPDETSASKGKQRGNQEEGRDGEDTSTATLRPDTSPFVPTSSDNEDLVSALMGNASIE